MNLKKRRKLVLFFILVAQVLFFTLPVKAQFFAVVQMESGLARFKSQEFYLLTRPKLQVGRRLNQQNFKLQWSVLYQPEFFNLQSATFSQRLNGQFSLNTQFNNWFWGIRFRTRYQSFKIEHQRYNWQSSDLVVDFSRWQSANFFWQGQGILWYRDTQQFDQQKLNSAIFRFGFGQVFKGLTLYTDLYFEQYQIKSQDYTLPENKGQRRGLALRLEHNKKFLLTLDYKLLWHKKNGFSQLKTDHQLDFLTGFWLTSKWALLIFAEYNKLTFFTSDQEHTLWYQPINSTNHLQLKISRDFARNGEFYLRFGFEQEKLIRPVERWQYWQAVLKIKKKMN